MPQRHTIFLTRTRHYFRDHPFKNAMASSFVLISATTGPSTRPALPPTSFELAVVGSNDSRSINFEYFRLMFLPGSTTGGGCFLPAVLDFAAEGKAGSSSPPTSSSLSACDGDQPQPGTMICIWSRSMLLTLLVAGGQLITCY
jgi:hypothetical protein